MSEGVPAADRGDADDDGPDSDDAPRLPQVAQSEAELLAIARAVIGGGVAHDELWAMLSTSRPLPAQIGPTAAGLLADTLRQVWRALWLRGGSRPGVSLRGGETSPRGRLWQRHPVQPLTFGPASVRLLRWLTATAFAAPPSTLTGLAVEAEDPAHGLAVGDQVVIYLALVATRHTPAHRILCAQPLVRSAALAWLGFADALAAGPPATPAFDTLTTGTGALVVEALTGDLAAAWSATELTKRAIVDPAALVALGDAQDATLTAWFAACDRAHRRDLAGFVIDAAAPLLARDVGPYPQRLDPHTALGVRARARVAAGALARGVQRWGAWDAEHRAIRYIDDDYAAAQFLLARFEAIGPHGIGRAGAWLAELAALSK